MGRTLVPLWTVPYPRNALFTGREAVLARLVTALRPGQAAALSQPTAISGLGGIGKTQLALEYAYQHRQDYQAVFWVRADTRENLVSDFVAMAGNLHLPEQDAREVQQTVTAVQAWLSTQGDWLLILDNADDLALAREFVPPSYGGQVLLTTRAQAMGRFAQRIEVDVMSPEVGMLFLLRRAGLLASDAELEQISPEERAQAGELVQELGGLPLALDQAGAYMEETPCRIGEYLQLYRTHRAALLRRRGGLVGDHPASVATTWSLAFAIVEQASPAAADLLRLCAFLHPDAIAEDLLRQGMNQLEPPLQGLGTDELAFHEAVRTLGVYSLLRRDPTSQSLSLHRLVQAVLIDAMASETRQAWVERIILLLSTVLPESGQVTFPHWEQWERLLPHALSCAAHLQRISPVSLQAARFLRLIGWYLKDRGQYSRAEPLLQQALVLVEWQLGKDQVDTATAVGTLAWLYHAQGKYVEAEPLFQRALAICEQRLGPYHPNTASSLNNLAELYRAQGKYAKAEPLFQRALAIREQRLGPHHPDTALSLNNLGALYYAQSKYAKAEPLFQRALVIREQYLGSNHPDTAQSLNNLAELYYTQSKYAEAEPLFQRALAIREQRLGPHHPVTASSLHSLALLYHAQSRYVEAEPLFQRALAIKEQGLPSDHLSIATTLENYAALLRVSNRPQEAYRFELRANAIRASRPSWRNP
jgi:tetratricopeptide (TPR) repeat protein